MAGWPPIKAGAFTLDFVFRDADGDLSTDAAGLTSVFSKDEAAFSSGTNSVVNETDGFYSLLLSSTEMDGDRVMVKIETTSTGIKPAAQVLYTNVVQVGTVGVGGITSTSFGADSILSTAIGDAAFIAAKFGTEFITSTSLAADTIIAEKIGADAITVAKIADSAFTTDQIDAGVFTKVWAESTRSITTLGVGLITSTSIADAAITAAKFAAGAISSGVVSTGQMETAAAAVWDRVLTGALHNIVNSAGRRLRQLQEAGGYSLGAVYIDTINGSTGTTSFEDGVETAPVAPIADANTIASNVGLSRFFVAPGSDITFAVSQVNQEFVGENWELALGGQIISGSHIQGAHILGIGTSTDEIHFDHCEMNLCTIGVAHVDECDIAGTITLSDAEDYFFIHCNHGGTTSIIDFSTSAGNQTVHVHDYVGQLTIENLGVAGTDVLHFDSLGANLTLSTSCVGGTVNLNGTFEFTNNGSTTITVNQAGRIINLVPTALVNGRMDADVGAMSSGVLTSTAIADDAITAAKIASNALTTDEIADGVFTKMWDESTRSLTKLGFALSSGDFDAGALSTGNIDQGVFDKSADAVWEEVKSDHNTTGTFGNEVQAHALSAEITALNDLSAADVNAEMVDVVNVDTFGEPLTSTSFPGVTASITDKLGTLQAALINRVDVSTDSKTIFTSGGDIAFTKTLTDTGVYSEAAATT